MRATVQPQESEDYLSRQLYGAIYDALTTGERIPVAVELPAAMPVEAPEARPAETAPEDEAPHVSRPLRQVKQGTSPPVSTKGRGDSLLYGTIPGFEQALTQHYIEHFSKSGGISWINSVIQRGAPYLAFIRQEIEARKLPGEFLYLPVIESGFQATIKSRSGATGIWQFMKNSIGPYDMKVDEWVDERADFWKSTHGALSKLEDNYRELGDWSLALAAYNAGLGGVSRILRQTGIRDYWELSEKQELKSETIHYVPRLLAISYILTHPRRFGITAVWPEDLEWTRVSTGGRMVDLGLLADKAGIDLKELKQANSELFFNVTPPDPNYYIKVRAQDAAAISRILAQKDTILVKYYFHTIRTGDTLSDLAQHYGISVNTILQANPGTRAQYLKVGARLVIPAFKEVGPYQQERNASKQQTAAGTHVVKKGETLWSIALSYNTTPNALASANSMGLNDTLSVGKKLKIPR
jgi:membrane-bound lytic murein transglycosylase D